MNVRFAILSAVPASILCLVTVEADGATVGWLRAPRPALVVLALGTVMSVLVAVADMQWADGYRRLARELATTHAAERVWFVGHWGFQHYATASGLVPYVPRDDHLETGDVVIVPLAVARQSIPEIVMAHLSVLEWHAIEPAVPLRTMTGGGGFYSTGWGPVPWGWSREPADVVVVARYD